MLRLLFIISAMLCSTACLAQKKGQTGDQQMDRGREQVREGKTMEGIRNMQEGADRALQDAERKPPKEPARGSGR